MNDVYVRLLLWVSLWWLAGPPGWAQEVDPSNNDTILLPPPFTDPVSLLYQRCPFKGDDPCECTFINDTGLTVVCSFLQSPQLKPMMDKVRQLNLSVNEFFCFRCRLVLPQSDGFQGLHFSAVHFRECQIESPAKHSSDSYQAILGGLELSLGQAYFINSQVSGLLVDDTCALGTLPALRRLSLTGANLQSIPVDFFCCSYVALEHVYLYENQIKALQRGALSRADNLVIFNANYNNISIIDRLFFAQSANKLLAIHLRYNQLQSLPHNLFSEMPSLKLVDLAHNQLTFLPYNAWQAIWPTLSTIYLDGNPLECECNLDWLPKIESALNASRNQSRFLTGSCQQVRDPNVTSPLENLDWLDIVCLDPCHSLNESDFCKNPV